MTALHCYYDQAMLQHDPGAGHPERPERLATAVASLREAEISGLRFERPRPATRQEIARVHDPAYIDRIDALTGESAQLDPDTAVSPGSVRAAYLAAGAAVQAVTGAVNGGESSRRAMVLARPPGHHAEANRAMGFCLFNSVAIAAAHAVDELACRRVLIVDFDVHHGNGTQHAFEHRPDVLVFNSHQANLFPASSGAVDETGSGNGQGFTVNAPLRPGFDDAAYLSLYRRVLLPIAQAYAPDLVLVSAGFDAHRDDPLGEMKLTEAGYAALTGLLLDIAQQFAGGRIVYVLEGGYNLSALAGSVAACARVLAGELAPFIDHEPDSRSSRVIDSLCHAHRGHWPV